MVRILEKCGVDVHYNGDQTCCGQPAFNNGFWDEARVFTGNKSFGDGIKAPELANMRLKERVAYGNSLLDIFIREESDRLKVLENMNIN